MKNLRIDYIYAKQLYVGSNIYSFVGKILKI